MWPHVDFPAPQLTACPGWPIKLAFSHHCGVPPVGITYLKMSKLPSREKENGIFPTLLRTGIDTCTVPVAKSTPNCWVENGSTPAAGSTCDAATPTRQDRMNAQGKKLPNNAAFFRPSRRSADGTKRRKWTIRDSPS